MKTETMEEGINKFTRKRDGSTIRRKEKIVQDYDESSIPWPIKPIVKLDYCWRMTYLMWQHSFVLATPLTLIHFIWSKNPHVWSYKLKTLPKLEIGINYLACVLLINAVNAAYSVCLEDYW